MRLFFFSIGIFFVSVVQAQPAYSINSVTGEFPVNKILNYTEPSSSFQHFKDKLVILDFFGTWCVPCIRALPKLSALQQKYKEQIRILLVSEEPQARLESFIKKQGSFTLPLIVDEEGTFIKLFQPPSYPYTVVIERNGKVIAIPAQEEMTEANIDKWLGAQNNNNKDAGANHPNKIDSLALSSANDSKNTDVEKSQNKLVQLSQEFMYAAKTGEETAGFVSQLKNISLGELMTTVNTDDEKKAFWINLYNAFTQVILKNDPEQYKKRSQFFGSKQIWIAGNLFSLDDIEHGLLRRSKIKWSLGYLNKLFPGKTEKKLRVVELDYRLHFALNCGAKSCPPIAFYKPEAISRELDLATKGYLSGEAEYDKGSNTVMLPALMGWFRRDFGGKKKMIALLKDLAIIPEDKNPKISFKDYDWTLYLQNYK